MPSDPESKPNQPSTAAERFAAHATRGASDDFIEFQELLSRLLVGSGQIIALSILGLVLALGFAFITTISRPVATTVKVVFSFPGLEMGENPDHTRFHADALCDPEIISEALKRQQLDTSGDLQGSIQRALVIEGVVPLSIAKERERLRANEQSPSFYVPDEYDLTLLLPHNFPMSLRQRELLLTEIVNVYREHFQRKFLATALQINFGGAFESLHNADYPDYQMILGADLQTAEQFLNGQIAKSKSYRSPTTRLTFDDLHSQLLSFSRYGMNEVLGLIYANGLSRDRTRALVGMNFYLETLDDEFAIAASEEAVYSGLLAKVLNRPQEYFLEIKNDVAHTSPEISGDSKGLVDSLVANDICNTLVQQAVEAGLKTKRAQAEQARYLRRRDALARADSPNQPEVMAQLQRAMSELEVRYRALISNISATYRDFEIQNLSDAVRITSEVASTTNTRQLSLAAGFGAALGLFCGVSLSLLGIYIGRRPTGRLPA